MLDDIRLAEGLLGLDGFLVLGVYEKPAELGAVVETGAAETAFCRGCRSRAEAQDRVPVQLGELPSFGRSVRLVMSSNPRQRHVASP